VQSDSAICCRCQSHRPHRSRENCGGVSFDCTKGFVPPFVGDVFVENLMILAGLTVTSLPTDPYPAPLWETYSIIAGMRDLAALEEKKRPETFGLDGQYRRKNRAANSRIAARNCSATDGQTKDDDDQE
jgi:hypothetical protein